MASPTRRPRRHAINNAIAVVIAIGFALAIVVGVPSLTKPVTRCALCPEVGSASIWTPGDLVNAPDGGSAGLGDDRLNWVFMSGSLVVGMTPPDGGGSISPGANQVGIVGVIGLAQWNFFGAQNVSSAFGTDDPCTQPYVAEEVGGLTCGASGNLTTILPLPDNSSDAVELHEVPPQTCTPTETSTPGAALWFDTSFHTGNASTGTVSESIRLCGPLFPDPLSITLPAVAKYQIVVSMHLPIGPIRSSGYTE